MTEPFVQTYRYDSLYRITEARETNGTATNASQNWKESFGYDRFGNRTTFTKFTGTTQLALDNKTFPSIDPATNRFNPNQGYGYDKNGNLTSDAEGRSFVFNGENKQAKISKDGKLVGDYDYNGEGQRVRKRTYDANGALQDTTVFVYSAGKLVAEYTTAAPPTNPTTRYTATDMLGSPRVITDSQGNVIARRDFKPFGEEITDNTGERTSAAKYGAADNLRQKFTTYQRDEETGLDFAEARMYENRHGRFTAVDPLLASGVPALPQTLNRYAYCINRPMLFVDPMGEKPVYVSKRLENGQVDFWWADDSTKDDKNLLKQGYEISKEGLGYRFVDTNGDVRELAENGFVNHGRAITKDSFDKMLAAAGIQTGFQNLPPEIIGRMQREAEEMGRAGETLLRALSPDYCKVEAGIPILFKIDFTLSQDFRLYFGGGKGARPGEFTEFLSQAAAFNMLKEAGDRRLGFKAGVGGSCGWFTSRLMRREDRNDAIEGTNISVSGPAGPLGVGFSQSIPQRGQTILNAPRAIEIGNPTKAGIGFSGSKQICDLGQLLNGGGC